MNKSSIAIIGGGINGICCALEFAKAGDDVTLFERDKLMSHTSRSSSKLLHGGLRYLENYEFRLVREALKERDAWIGQATHFAKAIRLIVPVYKNSKRGRFVLGAGLFLYDHLIGKSVLPKSKWLDAKEIARRDPTINTKGLKGGYEYSDGQMDDYKLGLWAAEKAKQAGATLVEHAEVISVNQSGLVQFGDDTKQFDLIVNVAGPWTNQLLSQSSIDSPYHLDIVRGSHLIIEPPCHQAYLLEVPRENRIFFVLPWENKTLLGTTEVRQQLYAPVECSQEEEEYLLNAYKHYFQKGDEENLPKVINRFAGVRPLLKSAADPTKATREYAIHQTGRLINVFGGKWTTALALSRKVKANAKKINLVKKV